MADDIYAFNSQSDIDRVAQSVRVTEGRFITGGGMLGEDTFPLFAKITSIVADTDNKQAKAIQVVPDASIGDYAEPTDPWIFDADDTSNFGQGDIYSTMSLAVDDVVQVFRYKDKSDESEFISIPVGAGVQRPIIQTAGVLAFGAELESIISKDVKEEFTETQSFRALLPWGETVILPDDYIFTADVDSSGTYYTEVFPVNMYVKPLESYPAATGITQFEIYESGIDTSLQLYNTATATTLYKLILADFDFPNASTPAKDYYNGKMFPVSFSVEDKAFYFISPLVG